MQIQRILSAWFIKYLTSIPTLLPLVAMLVGFWFPELQNRVQAATKANGLGQYASVRSGNSEFFAGAYLYWWALAIAIPFCLVRMYYLANKLNVHAALCATAVSNLRTNAWNPSKWTTKGGRLRLGGALALGIALVFTGLLVSKEPSFCKGCETGSLLGFILVNWLAIHAMLLYCYVMCVYFYFWKAIRSNLGEEK